MSGLDHIHQLVFVERPCGWVSTTWRIVGRRESRSEALCFTEIGNAGWSYVSRRRGRCSWYHVAMLGHLALARKRSTFAAEDGLWRRWGGLVAHAARSCKCAHVNCTASPFSKRRPDALAHIYSTAMMPPPPPLSSLSVLPRPRLPYLIPIPPPAWWLSLPTAPRVCS